MNKSELRQLIREAIKENDPFYKSDSYLDDPKPSRENVPDNITSVIDDMTITMGEEAFITAVFEVLPLETAKSVLRVITKDNPIEHPSGPVDYDWLNENDYPTSAPRVYVLMLGNRSRGVMGPYRVYADRAEAEAEAARQEDSGRDTRAFVQDLAFIK